MRTVYLVYVHISASSGCVSTLTQLVHVHMTYHHLSSITQYGVVSTNTVICPPVPLYWLMQDMRVLSWWWVDMSILYNMCILGDIWICTHRYVEIILSDTS